MTELDRNVTEIACQPMDPFRSRGYGRLITNSPLGLMRRALRSVSGFQLALMLVTSFYLPSAALAADPTEGEDVKAEQQATEGTSATKDDKSEQDTATSAAKPTDIIKEALANQNTFESTKEGVKISYPASWKLVTQDGMVFKALTLGGAVNTNMVTEDLKDGFTLDSYVDAIVEALAKLPGTDRFVSVTLNSKDSIDLSGQKAYELIYQNKVKGKKDDIVITQVLISTVRNNRGYCFTFNCPDVLFDRFKPVFDKMIGSIRFE